MRYFFLFYTSKKILLIFYSYRTSLRNRTFYKSCIQSFFRHKWFDTRYNFTQIVYCFIHKNLPSSCILFPNGNIIEISMIGGKTECLKNASNEEMDTGP